MCVPSPIKPANKKQLVGSAVPRHFVLSQRLGLCQAGVLCPRGSLRVEGGKCCEQVLFLLVPRF